MSALTTPLREQTDQRAPLPLRRLSPYVFDFGPAFGGSSTRRCRIFDLGLWTLSPAGLGP